MTDEELLKAGERLYNSFVQSPFSFLELAGLAAARERRTPWSQLGPRLKFAVFRLVIGPEPEGPAPASGDEPPVNPASVLPLAATPAAPGASTAPETSSSQEPIPSSTAPVPADPAQPPVAPDPTDSGEEADDHGDDHL